MTTGRINQITIVRRGWPTALARRRDLQVTGGTRGCAARSAPGVSPQRRSRQSAFPLCCSPGRPAAAEASEDPVASAPQEECASRAASAGWPPQRAAFSRCSVSGVASGQPSTEPIRRHRERAPSSVGASRSCTARSQVRGGRLTLVPRSRFKSRSRGTAALVCRIWYGEGELPCGQPQRRWLRRSRLLHPLDCSSGRCGPLPQ